MMDDWRKSLTQRKASSKFTENDFARMTRRLNDGREFQVVKVYYLPADLIERFKTYDLSVTVMQTTNFFLYGWGQN
jgi:hypothetical protein